MDAEFARAEAVELSDDLDEITPYENAVDLMEKQRKWKGDEALYVRFLYVPIFSQAKKHHIQVLHTEIHIPGKARAVVCRPTTDEDKERFSRQWGAFQRNQERPEDGTPIEECPLIDIARASDLKALKIFTCEQFAAQSDASLQRIMGGKSLCMKVQAWLDQRKGSNVIDKLVEDNRTMQFSLEQKDKALKDAFKRLEQLEKQAAKGK